MVSSEVNSNYAINDFKCLTCNLAHITCLGITFSLVSDSSTELIIIQQCKTVKSLTGKFSLLLFRTKAVWSFRF